MHRAIAPAPSARAPRPSRRWPTALAAGLLTAAACAGAARAATPDFAREVRPILARHCFACHGPDASQRRAGLRLDQRDRALEPTEGGVRAIVPAVPGESALVARIHATDPTVLMPPPEANRPLTAADKEVLDRWIAAGAPYARHWALEPPRRAGDGIDGLPPSERIDALLARRHAEAGIEPVGEADPVTLVRRLHFDLVGLPPEPAVVDAYLADPDPARYERLVDALLSSPRHAERMATWWLDLVRYADTVGYHGDQDHASSPYRDWVIAAFLADLPFDRFTVLQLAGDLVPPAAGEHPDDRLLASAYNRLLQTTHEGGLQRAEYRAIYQADRVRNLSAVWLGATLGCAQCHDHKYDPLTARDFHAVGAFFADIDDEQHLDKGGFGERNLNALPTFRGPERGFVGPFDRAEAARLDRRIAELAAESPDDVEPGEGPGAAAAAERHGELDEARRLRATLERPLMVTAALVAPRVVRILPRGDWMDESGEIVEPAVPAALGRIDAPGRATRADLARWLVTPGASGGVGEFTARVTANRLWAILFGVGLCRSLADFGGQGELPDHPELLDELAHQFVDGGSSVRRLLRTIVTSRAYRRSSAASAELVARDPDNRLLARQGRWRVSAEGVRDTALAVSGLLVERLGGPSARPYQPAGYYRHLNFPQREYLSDDGPGQWRRGLYVHRQRMFLHPQLLAFDAPNREECVAERARSNTPRGALVLLNDPTFVEAARALAERTLREPGDDDSRIGSLWRRAVCRAPDATERALLAGLLQRARGSVAADPAAAAALLAIGIAPRDPSLDAGETAAWTALARAVLNLHETFARN